jgi:hypothetical protein
MTSWVGAADERRLDNRDESGSFRGPRMSVRAIIIAAFIMIRLESGRRRVAV